MHKILVATGLYPPDIGGPATYAKMLERELPQGGFEPVVVPFGEVRHLPKGIRHLAYLRLLLQRVRACDKIYALDPISVGLPALLASKLTGKDLLVRLGGDYAWEQGRIRFGLSSTLDEYTADTSGRPLMVRLLAFLQGMVVRRARVVVVPSAYLKSIVVTWGVREERVRVIYSALFPLPVDADRAKLREQLNYDGVVLITAARLTPWKGVGNVIETLQQLREDGEEATLVVAGEGQERETLEAKAAELGVAKQVRFVGALSKEALGAAIKAADVFVLNTSYEGLPHQLLEVMDLGVPIVTTNIPGNREIINDGVHGLLVPPNDTEALTRATKRILENPSAAQRMVQNARVRSKDFQEEKVTRSLIELLRTL